MSMTMTTLWSSSEGVSWDEHRGEEAQARILRGHANRLRYFRDRRRHL